MSGKVGIQYCILRGRTFKLNLILFSALKKWEFEVQFVTHEITKIGTALPPRLIHLPK